MIIETLVLSCKRPNGETLGRTLDSLKAAGFDPPLVYRDENQSGQFKAWLAAVDLLLLTSPQADAYFLVEDDVVFCKGLRVWLVKNLWPDDPAKIALCSPYSPEAYQIPVRGWHREVRGLYLCSGQSWVVPPATLRRINTELHGLIHSPDKLRGGDYIIGQWALDRGLGVWFHSPSLGQHIGIGNGLCGGDVDSPLRKATDFVGEDFDANL